MKKVSAEKAWRSDRSMATRDLVISANRAYSLLLRPDRDFTEQSRASASRRGSAARPRATRLAAAYGTCEQHL